MARKIVFLSFLILFLIASSVFAFNLPDTGQTKCYRDVSPYDEIPCAGTGQDGEYNINPMSFTDNGNDTVTDKNTGLMWQKCSIGQNNDATCSGTATTSNWYKASGTYDAKYNPSSQNVCGLLNLGGYLDWRLPSKKELITIVDYSIPYPGPTIKTTYFPNTIQSSYWSSTTDAINSGYAWVVNFYYGYVTSNRKYFVNYVRCVRGGQSSPSFTDNGNGTVTDNKTGLVWQQNEHISTTWGSDLSYCKGLSLGGNTDWRLPNIKELESITDDTRYSPAIDTNYFPNFYASHDWSSTTGADGPDDAWYVSFYGGGVDDHGKHNYGNYVRCVRGGQSGGSLGNLDHFDISPVTSPQAVNTPFSVTITAKDANGNVNTGWSGEVVLSANTGSIYPVKAYLQNGSVTISDLTLDTGGCGIMISASGGGLSGTSNAFDVTGGAGSVSLSGTVRDGTGSRIAGVNVQLSGACAGNISPATTDSNGNYQFTNLTPGTYSIQAFNGTVNCSNCPQSTMITKPVFGNVTQNILITGSGCNPKGLTPVLLVPGIMGSSTGKLPYPTLPRSAPKWDVFPSATASYGLHDPRGWVGWMDLINDILKVDVDSDNQPDYQIGCNLFPVPYDWRMDLDKAATTYLKPWIDEAKKRAGTGKVNIVAHSMGGLVTRAYIQGGNFDDDIDKFAMVGTPNSGAELAYYLW